VISEQRLYELLRTISRLETDLEDERRANAELRRLLDEARRERDRALGVAA
jgi:hypothetical protein